MSAPNCYAIFFVLVFATGCAEVLGADFDVNPRAADGGGGVPGSGGSGGGGSGGAQANTCGDGVLDAAEECDDGDALESNGCTTECLVDCAAITPGVWVEAGSLNHCYSYDIGDVTWATARSACDIGNPRFHMVTLTSLEEVSIFVSAANPTDTVWVGGHDQNVESQFEWVTSEPWTHTPGEPPWQSGEPNDTMGQDCVALNSVSELEDRSCDTMERIGCEYSPELGP